MDSTITFGSVCSGIEAASVAFGPLGWHAAWLAEIEGNPSTILKHHYPDVPNLGDMNRIPQLLRNGDIPAPDVLCGGTPCQAFSVAGLRNSLDDARGNLSLKFCDIANEIDIQRAAAGFLPCSIVWENVPGVLSTKDNAFGCFLGQLAGEDCALVPAGGKWTNAGVVYGPQRAVAWRILDAQYFGVAQRRRRVLVVASARNGFDPAALLFESGSLRRDSPPSRETGQDVAAGALRSTDGGSDVDHGLAGQLQPVARTLCAGGHSNNPLDETLVTCLAHGQGGAEISVGQRPTLTCNHEAPIIAFNSNAQTDQMRFDPHLTATLTTSQSAAVCVTGAVTHTLKAEGFDASEDGTGRGQPIVAPSGLAVRRLTPRECELLQGFPSIREEVIIRICLDHQKNSVDAALLCRKLPTSALPVGVEKWMPCVPPVALDSSTFQASPELLAALRVRTNSVDELLEIHNHGRSIWSASNAGKSSEFRLPMPSGSIAAALAQPARALAREARTGRVESPVHIRLSIPAPNGAPSAQPSGAVSAAPASDAGNDANPAKFTMSDLGRAIPICDSMMATWLCSALTAIGSCTPNETLPENFCLLLDIETPYTLIPLPERRKSDRPGQRVMADGPRYKALGNSWAVPVFRWLGARIDKHLKKLDGKK